MRLEKEYCNILLVEQLNGDFGDTMMRQFLFDAFRKPLFETAKEIGIQNIIDELNKLAQENGEFYKPDPFLESMI